MQGSTRRGFVKGIVAGACVSLAERWGRASTMADRRGRLAVASYPFRAYLIAPNNSDRDPSKPGMDLPAFAVMVKERFGVTGIEPLYSHFLSTESGYLRKLRASFDAAGVRTVNIPVDVEVNLCSANAEERNHGYEVYRRWIDAAVILGSPSVRLHIPRCPHPADLGPPAASFRPIVDYAASRRIIVNLENDDPVLDNAARIVAFIRKVNSPSLRALPDFANSLGGGDAAFNARAVAEMFQLAGNIAHVKDAEIIQGKLERVDLHQLFGIAKAAHYRGIYSMESDSDVDPYQDTKHLIEATLRLM